MRRLLFAILMIVGLSQLSHAQSYELLTDPLRPFLDADGNPLALGKLRTCAAGATCTCTTTSSALTTYSDSSGTPNANPVILDSTGKATVYGNSSSYKLALCTSADVSVKTQDNIIAVGLASLNQFNHTTNTIPKFGGSNTLTTSSITDNGTTVTIGTSSTISDQLVLAKDSSTAFVISRASGDNGSPVIAFYKSRGTHASRADVQNGDSLLSIGGTAYSGGSFFAAGTALFSVDGTFTSGQAPPSKMVFYTNAANGAQTARLTINSSGYSIFSYRIQGAQGTDVVAANNLTLTGNGNVFVITGATQVNLLDTTGWQNGSIVTLQFSGAPTVKNNQSTSTTFSKILLLGSADFVASANDMLTLILVNSIWYEVSRTVI